MTKRIAAIVFIFFATTLAWMILGGTILARSESFGERLKGSVATTWGTAQVQSPPTADYYVPTNSSVQKTVDGKTTTETVVRSVNYPLPLERSDISVGLDLEHRQKGLLWYSTYKADFSGDYVFRNPTDQQQLVTFVFKFPAEKAIFDDFRMLVNDQPAKTNATSAGASTTVLVPAGEAVKLAIGYRSQGLDSWTYRFGSEVSEVKDFTLKMHTNFSDIDFPGNTLSPSEKQPTSNGWLLTWRYKSLLSGFDIGMSMPEKLQPGPLAGQISFFAPVSLFFFFFLMFIITTLRNIELHPMNYFFLAGAFFAFHLLMAYLVDHISIHAAFVICSLVSVFLVVSYLRLVVGMRFAAVEAGISQFIYLVLFSYAFFFKGYTGLAITIGSILTLFVVMQMTGRIRWADKFQQGAIGAKPATANPLNGTSMLG